MKGQQESLTTVVVKSWPTPVANDDNKTPEAHLAMKARMGERDGTHSNRTAITSLNVMVKSLHGPAAPASSSTDGSRLESWATPRAGKTTDENPETWAKRQAKGDVATMPLTAQVKSWQTATVSTGAHRQKDGSMIDKLDQQVKQSWPTPASAGVTGGPTGLAGGSGNREKLASMLPDVEARAMGCGKLNPRWVCTLMNVPVFWVKP